MRLFIEPLEPLMFRSALPFDAGEGNLAISTFPPTPETLQGAIRALIASLHYPKASMTTAFADPESKLVQLIGNRENYGRFRITQIGIGKYDPTTPEKVELLLPTPAHILQDEHKKRLQLVPKAISDLMIDTNQPDGITHVLALQERDVETKLEPLSGWLSQTSLQETLHPNAKLDILDVVKPEQIYEHESRLGIGIDSGTKRTRDGFLYQQQVIRMQKGFGFVVDIGLSTGPGEHTLVSDERVQEELFSQQTTGWLTIGGEQRTAYFRIVKDSTSSDTAQSGNDSAGAKQSLVYLATPAYFSTAWKPSAQFEFLDRPITAAVVRPQAIGGWKLNPGDAKGDQKGLRFCVPAGSVFFYNREVSISRPLTEYGEQIGYGITYTGDWKE
jgi:CRISPR-associated protein Cmr3